MEWYKANLGIFCRDFSEMDVTARTLFTDMSP